MKPLLVMICIASLSIAVTGCEPESDSNGGSGESPEAQTGLRILDANIPVVEIGDPLMFEFNAAGGVDPYSWEHMVGVLPGTLDVTVTGDLAGMVGPAGDFDFSIRVTDANNDTAYRTFTLTVTDPGVPQYHGGGLTDHLFLLDLSSDMDTVDPGHTETRLERSIAHVEAMMSSFNPTRHKFDIVIADGSGQQNLFPTPQFATPRIIDMAVDYMNTLTTSGTYRIYSAVKHACLDYGSDLAAVFFYSGTRPWLDPEAPNGMATQSNVLADFSTWWTNQTGMSEFWTIDASDGSNNHDLFLQQLAALGNGQYYPLP